MKITKEILIANEFKLDKSEYRRTVVNKNGECVGKFWHIAMRYDISNTQDRDWSCHIDNCVCNSIAYVDIDTIEHFNKLMQLMDIEYRLKNC